MQTEMSSSPTGGLCLPAGKHVGILTVFQTIVNKKMTKKALFLLFTLSISEGSPPQSSIIN